MGIFDKILKAVGFEDVAEEGKKEKSKDKKEKGVNVNSKFDLKGYEEIKNERLGRIENLYNPLTQDDVETIATNFVKGENSKIDFSNFEQDDRIRALDFLSGVVFVLNGDMEKVDKNVYLLKNKD